MIAYYAASEPGPRHIASGSACQDAYSVAMVGDALVCAVADGLGSETHSDIGARVATDAAVGHIIGRLGEASWPTALESLIYDSFSTAASAVLERSQALAIDVGQMDCTLCAAIFCQGHAWWGNVGDSGIIVCRLDGSYQLVTECQRDAEGRVYPLCFKSKWELGHVDGVSSLLLATDGILWDLFAPPAVSAHGGLDTHTLRTFLHPLDEDATRTEELASDLKELFRMMPDSIANDDRTLVVAFDTELPPTVMPGGYYDAIDWHSVSQEICNRLYPVAKETRQDDSQSNRTGDPTSLTAVKPRTSTSAADIPMANQVIQAVEVAGSLAEIIADGMVHTGIEAARFIAETLQDERA